MAKVKDYFSHDYHARDHLRDVRKDFGLEGYGLYWCIVEILHENGGSIKEIDVDSIAFDLRADQEMARAILYNYGMFKIKGGKITSTRVVENLQKREEISEKRRLAAQVRWDDGKPLNEVVLDEEDRVDPQEREKAKEFYINNINQSFEKWCEKASLDDLFRHNIYDYRNIFKAVIEDVRSKEYVAINRQNVPVFRFLQIIQRHIFANNSLTILDTAMRDIDKRYAQGKIKNKTNYMIATLYNTALILNEKGGGNND